MKQLLYIPTGQIFKFYDVVVWEEFHEKRATWSIETYLCWSATHKINNSQTYEEIIDFVVKKNARYELYTLAGIDIRADLQVNEFEIIDV